jgi:hypothetical protein
MAFRRLAINNAVNPMMIPRRMDSHGNPGIMVEVPVDEEVFPHGVVVV